MPRAKKPDPEKEAIDLLKEAAFHPSLDKVWEKHPAKHSPEEREALVAALRTERALWRAQDERRQKRKAERAEGKDPDKPAVEPQQEAEDDW